MCDILGIVLRGADVDIARVEYARDLRLGTPGTSDGVAPRAPSVPRSYGAGPVPPRAMVRHLLRRNGASRQTLLVDTASD